mgnify:CR=1 FL=1
MNVLIVDDEPQARERLSRLVSELEGYTVLEPSATSGEEALTLIDSHKPDVVLLDIRMPGKTGMEAASVIGNKSIIVFVTAYDAYAVEAFERALIADALQRTRGYGDDDLAHGLAAAAAIGYLITRNATVSCWPVIHSGSRP